MLKLGRVAGNPAQNLWREDTCEKDKDVTNSKNKGKKKKRLLAINSASGLKGGNKCGD
jgi:hypothetical protein